VIALKILLAVIAFPFKLAGRAVGFLFRIFWKLFGPLIRLFWRIAFRLKLGIAGILVGFLIVFGSHQTVKYTSTDKFCDSCHVHPHVVYSWKQAKHFKNEEGIVVNCVDCHLPAGGIEYYTEKARLGIRDAWGAAFADIEAIDWDQRSTLEHAMSYTYDSACMKCHSDLYSLGLEPKGVEAHEYYLKNTDKLRCINCHLTVGHFHSEPVEEIDYLTQEKVEMPEYAPDSGEFATYSEQLLDTGVAFNMIAIPGGSFMMGSPADEDFRGEDEGDGQFEVALSPFWMGEIEVSWREFDVFYAMTADTGKDKTGSNVAAETASLDTSILETPEGVDAVTGPTPPYGSPDQGWGKGLRPAITMSHHGAMKYCEWLSEVTGKTYRLPTEAEWEYACRAESTGSYPFDGEPKKLTANSLKNKWFGRDTSVIDQYVWYDLNSKYKTQPPYENEANDFGLYNMLGNVKEFCLDWYSPEIYSTYMRQGKVTDPKGPSSGKERVVRGGTYDSDPAELRSADRDMTQHDKWMLTDPQSPKSIWWYSDTREVGFRIVRVYE